MISDERIERAARAIFRGFLHRGERVAEAELDRLWHLNSDRRNEALYHAREALAADAPEIAAAEIRGLEMAKEIAEGQQTSDFDWGQRYPDEYDKMNERAHRAGIIAWAINRRIAELKAKTEPAK